MSDIRLPGEKIPAGRQVPEMTIDLVVLVLAPVIWVAGYAGYGQTGRALPQAKTWLAVAGAAAATAILSSVILIIFSPGDPGGTVLNAIGGSCLVLESAWFLIGATRSRAG
jgi:hypothetical protein